MVFACQRDSYLKEYTTTVVACKSACVKAVVNGKPQKLNGYEVILKDTVLFPEGGGQPDDRGTINELPVLRVTRQGADAIHFIETPLEVGSEVKLMVNWERRFDHMQQHSGQHLITAIADKLYGYKTTSWNLGEKASFIELDSPNVSTDQMKEIEKICNEKIREHLPVFVKVYEEGSSELQEVRSRGLPDDHVGAVRVVVMDGIDENMCCGTHVTNLSQLQVVALLYVEKGKKNKTNLFFLVGNRVISNIADTVQKDKALTECLKCGPDQYVELVEKLQKSIKISQKNESTLLQDIAVAEADKFKMINPKPPMFSLHRKEGTPEFMSMVMSEIGDEEVLLFLTIGEEKGPGQVLLAGKPSVVAELGPKLMEILDGKGAAKGSRFNGKVKNLSQRSKAEQLLREATGSDSTIS